MMGNQSRRYVLSRHIPKGHAGQRAAMITANVLLLGLTAFQSSASPSHAAARKLVASRLNNSTLSRVEVRISRLNDTRVSLKERTREIRTLGRRNDHESVYTLMVLADGSTYANSRAVEALGEVHSPEVRSYLLEKLTTAPQHDISLIRATIHAVASALGPDAVKPLTAYLRANRNRDDGFRVLLSTTCVEALGDIGTSSIIEPLADELRYMEQTELNLEYGSTVVAALEKTGDRSALPVLRHYEQVVRYHMPGYEHQRSYYAMRIDEVRTIIEGLSTK